MVKDFDEFLKSDFRRPSNMSPSKIKNPIPSLTIVYVAYTLSRAYRKTKVLSEYLIVSFQRVMTKGSVGDKANFRNLLDPGQLALVDIFTTFWT